MPSRFDKLHRVLDASFDGVDAELADLGREIVTDIKASISVPYPPASEPGQPPHMRTGNLRRSYKFRVEGARRKSRRDRTLTIESDPAIAKDYPLYLEFGTSRMAARPHVRPAVARHTAEVTPRIAKAIHTSQRGAI